MLTQQERVKLLGELTRLAPKMSDDDLRVAAGFVRDSVKENPHQNGRLRLAYPVPLGVRR